MKMEKKIKQHLIITDPLEFMRGDYGSCFTLFETESRGSGDWIDCGEIELSINVDEDDIRKTCLAKLDEEEAKANAKMTMLERARNELLCLTHEGSDE
jgi:hypothetical protein